MKSTKISAKKIALGGILGALAVICLFFATVLPTGRLSLYSLSSFFVAVIIIEAGTGAGWIFYAATGILSLILLPDKTGVLPYVIFFGLYGIIKYYIEKLNRLIPEYILKFAYFNICFFTALYAFKSLFLVDMGIDFPWWILVIIFEVVFFVYDFVYTLFIDYFKNRIKPRIKL